MHVDIYAVSAYKRKNYLILPPVNPNYMKRIQKLKLLALYSEPVFQLKQEPSFLELLHERQASGSIRC